MKKSKTYIFFLMTAMALCNPSNSCADVLGSFQFEHTILPEHTHVTSTPHFTYFLGPYGDDNFIIGGEYYPEWGPLFDLYLTAADVQKTYIVNSGVAYDIAVDTLTNGIMDSASWFMWWEGAMGTGQGGPEKYFTGAGEIDYRGYSIESVAFRLDYDEPLHYGFTIMVNGTPVPESSTILLLGAGLIGLVFAKRFCN